MTPIRIALVGLGKIARDQHLPTIAAGADFELVATVGPGAGIDGVVHHPDLAALLAEGSPVEAVALCTPPQVRYGLAAQALAAGLHVLLEKPPGATTAEVRALGRLAERADLALFASWHSRYAAGVPAARAWLADKTVERIEVVWREDVRRWHPGQTWIWRAGGLGVFDPGVNALSIVTHILPQPIFLTSAVLTTPENCAAPIAAELVGRDAAGAPVAMDFDFRQTGPQTWDIAVHTTAGVCALTLGGAQLSLPGPVQIGGGGEYARPYARLADLVRTRRRDVDIAPLSLVADAFLIGRRQTTEPFFD